MGTVRFHDIASSITVTSQWARGRIKSPASRVFAPLFAQAQIKNSKLRVTGLWERNPSVTSGFPSHKGTVTRKKFPFDDAIMFICILQIQHTIRLFICNIHFCGIINDTCWVFSSQLAIAAVCLLWVFWRKKMCRVLWQCPILIKILNMQNTPLIFRPQGPVSVYEFRKYWVSTYGAIRYNMYDWYQISAAKYQTSEKQNTSIHATHLCGLFYFEKIYHAVTGLFCIYLRLICMAMWKTYRLYDHAERQHSESDQLLLLWS